METTEKKITEPKGKTVEPPKFIPTNELTEEHFANLKKVSATFLKQVSKKGFASYYFKAKIHPLLVISIQLKEDRFNQLRLRTNRQIFDHNGREIFEHNFFAPYRFVKGTTKDGREYLSVQFILGHQLTETHFFNDYAQKDVLEMLQKNNSLQIQWEVSPEAIDSAENLNFGSQE
jgi:hypothetical protein